MMRVSVILVTLSVLFQAALISAKRSKKNVGVYGGETIRIEEAPWMALVFAGLQWPSAGTIIDPRFILTIDTACNGHERARSDWYVRVGRGGPIVKVQDAYTYTDPKPKTDYKLKPVLCLLKLKTPLTYSNTIQPASLDEPSIVIENGTEVDFVAFGRSAPSSSPLGTRGLRRTKLPIADVEWCKAENKRLGGGQICAGNREHNACNGDGGGALTSGKNLIGVLSEVTSGCRSNPSRFCRISYYRPWINATMQKNQ